MSKHPVLYLLLFIVFLLLLSSYRPKLPSGGGSSDRGRGRRGPGRRIGHHRHAAFDPLVEQLERRAVESGLLDIESFRKRLDAILAKHGSDWTKMSAAELAILDKYFGDEGRLNQTERMMYLFPLLDRSPKDGQISFHELEAWNQKQALDQLQRNTERKTKKHDKDGDGNVSLDEFFSSYLNGEEPDLENLEHRMPGWWRERFVNADVNKNGLLNLTELTDFFHPEDSRNPNVQMWLLKESLRELDSDGDGKLSSEEYFFRAYQMHQNHLEFEEIANDDGPHMGISVEKEFTKLDKNKDGFLTAEELKPMVHLLCPGELSYARDYTKYLMREADDDKNGKLTLKEMLNHQHAFYETVIFDDDNYDDDHYQDELR